VRMKRNDTHVPVSPFSAFRLPTAHKRFTRPAVKMQQTEFTDEYGRQVIGREWRNTDGQLHRTTGPAWEEWTVLPSGAHTHCRVRVGTSTAKRTGRTGPHGANGTLLKTAPGSCCMRRGSNMAKAIG